MIKNKILKYLLICSGILGTVLNIEATSMVQINDNNIGENVNEYQYAGYWLFGGQPGAYNSDNHWSNSVNSTYQIDFLGTQIDLYAAKASVHGIAAISLDDGPEVLVDCYSADRLDDALIYSSSPLSYDLHKIKVRVTGKKNSASYGTTITADRAVVHTTNPIITDINDSVIGTDYNQFNYMGSWQYGGQSGAYDLDNHWSNQTNSSFIVRFIGSQILLFGAQLPNNGIAAISIDNGPAVYVDCYASNRNDQVLLYTSPVLRQGTHVLNVKVTGTKNANSTGYNITADRVSIISYPQSIIPEPDFSYTKLSTGLFAYRPISLLGRSWNVEMYIYGYLSYPANAIKASSAKYKLTDTFGDTYYNNLYEWDYTYHFLNGNGYRHVPTNPQDAYEMIKGWYLTELTKIENKSPPWISAITGHYYYPHYSALWGGDKVDMLMSEVGENIKSTNLHLAFVRGAARQFNKPWGLQFSPWYGGYVLDYSSTSVWGSAGGKTNGHSLELAKRTYFLTYMSGANELHAESGSVNWFNGSALGSDGTFSLSPMGVIGQAFYAFSHSFKDRGIPLTPMAIMLDHYHGLSNLSLTQSFYGTLSPANTQKVGFNFTPGQLMNIQLFNTLWPQSFSDSNWDESKYFLVNSSHGDMYDIILDNADLSVISAYPVLYMGGDVTMTTTLADTLQQYVKKGGTLILNSSQISFFTSSFIGATFGSSSNIAFGQLTWNASGQSIAYTSSLNVPTCQLTTATSLLIGKSGSTTTPLATINSVGNGKVIVTTPMYLQDTKVLDFFVKSLIQPLNPFKIEGDIEYLVNKNSTGWVLTLINNLGIKKSPTTPTVVDSTQASTVRITYKEAGKTIKSVTEVINNTAISLQKNHEFTVTVPAGDVRILNIPIF